MLEDLMTQAGEALRAKGYTVTMVTEDAVIDGPVNDRGRLPDNPDLGAGSKPGTFVLVANGKRFDEHACANLGTVEAIVAMVEGTP